MSHFTSDLVGVAWRCVFMPWFYALEARQSNKQDLLALLVMAT